MIPCSVCSPGAVLRRYVEKIPFPETVVLPENLPDMVERDGSRRLSMRRESMIDDITLVKVVGIPRIYGPVRTKVRILVRFDTTITPK